MLAIFFILLLVFAPEIVLVLAGLCARSRDTIVCWGIIAGLLKGLQGLCFLYACGLGETWGGEGSGITLPMLLLSGFVMVFIVCFQLALRRLEKNGDKAGHRHP